MNSHDESNEDMFNWFAYNIPAVCDKEGCARIAVAVMVFAGGISAEKTLDTNVYFCCDVHIKEFIKDMQANDRKHGTIKEVARSA